MAEKTLDYPAGDGGRKGRGGDDVRAWLRAQGYILPGEPGWDESPAEKPARPPMPAPAPAKSTGGLAGDFLRGFRQGLEDILLLGARFSPNPLPAEILEAQTIAYERALAELGLLGQLFGALGREIPHFGVTALLTLVPGLGQAAAGGQLAALAGRLGRLGRFVGAALRGQRPVVALQAAYAGAREAQAYSIEKEARGESPVLNIADVAAAAGVGLLESVLGIESALRRILLKPGATPLKAHAALLGALESRLPGYIDRINKEIGGLAQGAARPDLLVPGSLGRALAEKTAALRRELTEDLVQHAEKLLADVGRKGTALFTVASKAAREGLIAGATEGTEEVLQQIYSELVRRGRLPGLEDVSLSFLGGAFVGSILGGGVGALGARIEAAEETRQARANLQAGLAQLTKSVDDLLDQAARDFTEKLKPHILEETESLFERQQGAKPPMLGTLPMRRPAPAGAEETGQPLGAQISDAYDLAIAVSGLTAPSGRKIDDAALLTWANVRGLLEGNMAVVPLGKPIPGGLQPAIVYELPRDPAAPEAAVDRYIALSKGGKSGSMIRLPDLTGVEVRVVLPYMAAGQKGPPVGRKMPYSFDAALLVAHIKEKLVRNLARQVSTDIEADALGAGELRDILIDALQNLEGQDIYRALSSPEVLGYLRKNDIGPAVAKSKLMPLLDTLYREPGRARLDTSGIDPEIKHLADKKIFLLNFWPALAEARATGRKASAISVAVDEDTLAAALGMAVLRLASEKAGLALEIDEKLFQRVAGRISLSPEFSEYLRVPLFFIDSATGAVRKADAVYQVGSGLYGQVQRGSGRGLYRITGRLFGAYPVAVPAGEKEIEKLRLLAGQKRRQAGAKTGAAPAPAEPVAPGPESEPATDLAPAQVVAWPETGAAQPQAAAAVEEEEEAEEPAPAPQHEQEKEQAEQEKERAEQEKEQTIAAPKRKRTRTRAGRKAGLEGPEHLTAFLPSTQQDRKLIMDPIASLNRRGWPLLAEAAVNEGAPVDPSSVTSDLVGQLTGEHITEIASILGIDADAARGATAKYLLPNLALAARYGWANAYWYEDSVLRWAVLRRFSGRARDTDSYGMLWQWCAMSVRSSPAMQAAKYLANIDLAYPPGRVSYAAGTEATVARYRSDGIIEEGPTNKLNDYFLSHLLALRNILAGNMPGHGALRAFLDHLRTELQLDDLYRELIENAKNRLRELDSELADQLGSLIAGLGRQDAEELYLFSTVTQAGKKKARTLVVYWPYGPGVPVPAELPPRIVVRDAMRWVATIDTHAAKIMGRGGDAARTRQSGYAAIKALYGALASPHAWAYRLQAAAWHVERFLKPDFLDNPLRALDPTELALHAPGVDYTHTDYALLAIARSMGTGSGTGRYVQTLLMARAMLGGTRAAAAEATVSPITRLGRLLGLGYTGYYYQPTGGRGALGIEMYVPAYLENILGPNSDLMVPRLRALFLMGALLHMHRAGDSISIWLAGGVNAASRLEPYMDLQSEEGQVLLDALFGLDDLQAIRDELGLEVSVSLAQKENGALPSRSDIAGYFSDASRLVRLPDAQGAGKGLLHGIVVDIKLVDEERFYGGKPGQNAAVAALLESIAGGPVGDDGLAALRRGLELAKEVRAYAFRDDIRARDEKRSRSTGGTTGRAASGGLRAVQAEPVGEAGPGFDLATVSGSFFAELGRFVEAAERASENLLEADFRASRLERAIQAIDRLFYAQEPGGGLVASPREPAYAARTGPAAGERGLEAGFNDRILFQLYTRQIRFEAESLARQAERILQGPVGAPVGAGPVRPRGDIRKLLDTLLQGEPAEYTERLGRSVYGKLTAPIGRSVASAGQSEIASIIRNYVEWLQEEVARGRDISSGELQNLFERVRRRVEERNIRGKWIVTYRAGGKRIRDDAELAEVLTRGGHPEVVMEFIPNLEGIRTPVQPGRPEDFIEILKSIYGLSGHEKGLFVYFDIQDGAINFLNKPFVTLGRETNTAIPVSDALRQVRQRIGQRAGVYFLDVHNHPGYIGLFSPADINGYLRQFERLAGDIDGFISVVVGSREASILIIAPEEKHRQLKALFQPYHNMPLDPLEYSMPDGTRVTYFTHLYAGSPESVLLESIIPSREFYRFLFKNGLTKKGPNRHILHFFTKLDSFIVDLGTYAVDLENMTEEEKYIIASEIRKTTAGQSVPMLYVLAVAENTREANSIWRYRGRHKKALEQVMGYVGANQLKFIVYDREAENARGTTMSRGGFFLAMARSIYRHTIEERLKKSAPEGWEPLAVSIPHNLGLHDDEEPRDNFAYVFFKVSRVERLLGLLHERSWLGTGDYIYALTPDQADILYSFAQKYRSPYELWLYGTEEEKNTVLDIFGVREGRQTWLAFKPGQHRAMLIQKENRFRLMLECS